MAGLRRQTASLLNQTCNDSTLACGRVPNRSRTKHAFCLVTHDCMTNCKYPGCPLDVQAYSPSTFPNSGRICPRGFSKNLLCPRQVVLGTETDLLMAWRCHSDFCSLAEKARRNGAHRTSRSWDQIHHKIGRSGKMDPARLKLEARYMSHFLTAVLQELGGTYSEVCFTPNCDRMRNKV